MHILNTLYFLSKEDRYPLLGNGTDGHHTLPTFMIKCIVLSAWVRTSTTSFTVRIDSLTVLRMIRVDRFLELLATYAYASFL
jgi:hypothetical protein